MTMTFWSGDRSRKIIARLVVEGDLELQTPAHFGNGDTDDLVDMPLLVDPLDGKTPLLTGASLAGALRAYLSTREIGYSPQTEQQPLATVSLFGTECRNQGNQSVLIVEDALGQKAAVELREGVRLDTASRTAQAEALFDLQLWAAGTIFPLRFELSISRYQNEAGLKQALATALTGLTDGGITLGARKQRGYGEVKIREWHSRRYDLIRHDDLLDWLTQGDEPLRQHPGNKFSRSKDIHKLLGVNTLLADCRQFFRMQATFSLNGSLLIAGGGQEDVGPDKVHRHSYRTGTNRSIPILPGTSLAGVLRARTLRIANTLHARHGGGSPKTLIENLFGSEKIEPGMQKKAKASRVTVAEQAIGGAIQTELVQHRVRIDRFTGGAFPTALFNEQPVFGGDDSEIMLDIHLREPQDYEIGLLLLLLKDLWTGDLPLGGESGVGRGRLRGNSVTLTLHNSDNSQEWIIARPSQTSTTTVAMPAKGKGSQRQVSKVVVTRFNKQQPGQSQENLQVSGDKKKLEDYVIKLRDYFTKQKGEKHG